MTSPDVLNNLHTLKQLAADVKGQLDSQRQWRLAALVATIHEEAVEAIAQYNRTEQTFHPLLSFTWIGQKMICNDCNAEVWTHENGYTCNGCFRACDEDCNPIRKQK